MPDLLATSPSTRQQASTETIPWACDLTALLGVGETPSVPSCQLIDLATGVNYAAGLSGSATIVGNSIRQTVAALVAGHVYLLIFTFTAAVGKIFSPAVRIECPR